MDQTKDYRQLNDTISGLLLLQKSNLLLPSLKEAVRLEPYNSMNIALLLPDRSNSTFICHHLPNFIQGHPTDNLVSKLLESVFLTLRPLVSKKQSSAKASTWCTLSPANKQSTELVLELALNIGVTVSLHIPNILQI